MLEVRALFQVIADGPAACQRSNFILNFIGRNPLVAPKSQNASVGLWTKSCRPPWTLLGSIVFGIIDEIFYDRSWPIQETRNFHWRLALVLVGHYLSLFKLGKSLSATHIKDNFQTGIILTKILSCVNVSRSLSSERLCTMMQCLHLLYSSKNLHTNSNCVLSFFPPNFWRFLL